MILKSMYMTVCLGNIYQLQEEKGLTKIYSQSDERTQIDRSEDLDVDAYLLSSEK